MAQSDKKDHAPAVSAVLAALNLAALGDTKVLDDELEAASVSLYQSGREQIFGSLFQPWWAQTTFAPVPLRLRTRETGTGVNLALNGHSAMVGRSVFCDIATACDDLTVSAVHVSQSLMNSTYDVQRVSGHRQSLSGHPIMWSWSIGGRRRAHARCTAAWTTPRPWTVCPVAGGPSCSASVKVLC